MCVERHVKQTKKFLTYKETFFLCQEKKMLPWPKKKTMESKELNFKNKTTTGKKNKKQLCYPDQRRKQQKEWTQLQRQKKMQHPNQEEQRKEECQI